MSKKAMKLALEALEEAWYHVGTFQPTEKAIDLYDEARAALREALAEQPAQQEPVATLFGSLPVYDTAPPAQRTWVGLTDEEMHACWDSPLTPLGMKHARMIEAKLKEKNT